MQCGLYPRLYDQSVLQSDAGSLELAAAELSKAASLLVSIERHIISMQQDGVSSVHAVWRSLSCSHKNCYAVSSFSNVRTGHATRWSSLQQLVLPACPDQAPHELDWKHIASAGCLVIPQTLST